MIPSRLNFLVALAGLASAHFTLNFPPTRGFEEEQEVNAPCGGFNSVGTRTPFPLGDAHITIEGEHENPNIMVLISFVDNPTSIENFTTTSNGEQQAPLRAFFQVEGGDVCIGVNVQSVGYPQAQNGTNATIAIQYTGGDGNLFQCADVVLLSSATIPSNVTCSNEYQATSIGSSGTSSGNTGTNSQPSPTQGGGGAGGANRLTTSMAAIIFNVLGLGLYLL